MRLVLYKEDQVVRPTQSIVVTFDGKSMKTYFSPEVATRFSELGVHTPEAVEVSMSEFLCDSREAKLGDAFSFTPMSRHPPVISPISLPSSRGERIAWALSFVEEETHAHSYEDFFKRYSDVRLTYNSDEYFLEARPEAYAFMLARKNPGKNKKRAGRLKPLFVWISDTISEKDLGLLIEKYESYRSIHLPPEYLFVL